MIYKNELDKACGFVTANKHNLSIAESVTAGQLQSVFSNVKDASCFFEGGITAYNLQQKCTHLFIDPAHAISCNCVSEKVAVEMALGISKSFNTNWAIAVTGYASPVPELNIEELFACYAFSFNNKIIKQATIMAVTEDPEDVQHFYVMSILEEFIQCCIEIEEKQKNNILN